MDTISSAVPVSPLPEHAAPYTQVKFEIGDDLKFMAFGDRVLIQEDEFRTGYECSQCGGSGRLACDNCKGAGHNDSKKCSICEGNGLLTCASCNGKGGILVAPETSQHRPSSGTIVSAGRDVKHLSVGQSVLYSNFAGYVVDLSRAGKKICLRILHETEILCGVEGHLTLSNLRGKSDIAQFNN